MARNLGNLSHKSPISVTLSDGTTFDGFVKSFDRASDIALVQIVDPPPQLPTALIGRSSDLRVRSLPLLPFFPHLHSTRFLLSVTVWGKLGSHFFH